MSANSLRCEVFPMTFHSRLVLFGAVLSLGWLAAPPELRAESQPTAEQLAFFEKSIRPVLVKECYSCHATNAEKIRGGLLLDTRDGIRKGGEKGPAVVPGDAAKSLMVQAIKHVDENFK